MTDDILKQERERIKKLVQERIERFEQRHIIKKKRRRKDWEFLAYSFVMTEMESLKFRIDNPDYVNEKNR